MVAPEGIKNLAKNSELLVPLDEERAAGMEHLVTRVEIDVRESLGQIEDASNGNIEAHAPQQASKDDEVLDETPDLQLPTPKLNDHDTPRLRDTGKTILPPCPSVSYSQV